jgi:hypothetical protein
VRRRARIFPRPATVDFERFLTIPDDFSRFKAIPADFV